MFARVSSKQCNLLKIGYYCRTITFLGSVNTLPDLPGLIFGWRGVFVWPTLPRPPIALAWNHQCRQLWLVASSVFRNESGHETCRSLVWILVQLWPGSWLINQLRKRIYYSYASYVTGIMIDQVYLRLAHSTHGLVAFECWWGLVRFELHTFSFPLESTCWVGNVGTDFVCPCQWGSCGCSDRCTLYFFWRTFERSLCNRRRKPLRSVFPWLCHRKWRKMRRQ